MDLSPDATVALAIAALLLVLFLGLMIGMTRRGSDNVPAPAASTNDRLLAVENRLLEAEQKLNKISVEIQHLPTAETVSAMAVKIADIGGDVKALHSSVLSTNRLVERIDQYLLQKGS